MFGMFGRGHASPGANPLGVHLSQPPAVIYAIGDIHGCLDKLKHLEARIVADAESVAGEKLIITLGDYVDRGPASARTLEWLMRPAPRGFRRICLRGNHEAAFLAAIGKPAACGEWLSWGGRETLASYGVDPDNFERLSGPARGLVLQSVVPQEQIAFMANCPYYVSTNGFVFVHAGIRPGVALERQRAEDLLWIREPFLSQAHGLPMVVVHGHTPMAQPSITDYRIGIDTGAYDGGPLTAVKIQPSGQLTFFTDH
ncbi:metallophosphoesterase family protein [Devosia alba]|uniref:metallophosphoesterase family protein n=1 Tax=Devosia alba TaxID=3152360 RepID=UPI0032673642